ADGAPDWDAKFLAPNVESYRAYRLPWAGVGEERPAAVVRGRRVFVSWNGATGVASWRVTPAGGAPVTAERTGFETEITLPRRAASVRVAALGADGEVLGRSG
ncbi:MAG: ArsR family transcriptional regulator, partial [Solirubrobacteraceae bacterium]